MKTSLVLTLIGPDRPGVVETVSRLIAAHDGNWEESRMAHLAGKFAGILRIELPEARCDALVRALSALESEAGLRVVAETSVPEAADDGATLRLEVVAQDREGIVRDISEVLTRRGVNVEELATACEEAPLSGGTLFRARARLRPPAGCDIEQLRASLEALADDLVVDVSADDGEHSAR